MDDEGCGKGMPQVTFARKPTTITARRCAAEAILDTHTGPVAVMPGDWILQKADGEEYPIRADDLRALYNPADSEACAAFSHECSACRGANCPHLPFDDERFAQAMSRELGRTEAETADGRKAGGA